MKMMLCGMNLLSIKQIGNTFWNQTSNSSNNIFPFRQVPLHTGNTQKGFLTYTAEFYPTMALAEMDNEEEEEEEKEAVPSQDLSIAVPEKSELHDAPR